MHNTLKVGIDSGYNGANYPNIWEYQSKLYYLGFGRERYTRLVKI